MRNRILTYLLLLPLLCLAQGQAENRIIVSTFLDADGSDSICKILYYDELGREEQRVLVGGSPTGKDLVAITQYDRLGRASRHWLPTPSTKSTGEFTPTGDFMDDAREYHTDSCPYSTNAYEASPLARINALYGEGEDWYRKGKCVSTIYALNNKDVEELNVLHIAAKKEKWSVAVPIIKNIGYYPSGTLQATITTDEDGRKTYAFHDFDNRLVLTRQVLDGDFCDTYFIYDATGNLLAVLPPLASEQMSETGTELDASLELGELAYVYFYDHRGRCTSKKLPGQDFTSYVYDTTGKAVFHQDPWFQKHKKWGFEITDTWGRICLKGLCENNFSCDPISPVSLPTVNARRTSGGKFYGYEVSGVELRNPTFLKVNYYDNHSFLKEGLFPDSLTTVYTSKDSTLSCKGLLTGSINCVIAPRDCQRAYETFYYDSKGRDTCSYRSNLLGGYTHKSKVYDYVGNLLELSRSNHTADNPDIYESFTYTYDRHGRLMTEKHCLNNGLTREIANYTYDGTGRIASCRRNESAKYATNYKYNIRGWQTEIASSRFKETLFYNTKDANNHNTPCYNGNISAVEWGFRYGTQNDFDRQIYTYKYDELDRLTSAKYYNAQQSKDNWYSTDYIYDKQGNVLWLSRNNYDVVNDRLGLVDDAHFQYNGNKLLGYQDIGFENSLQDITLPNNYDGGVQFTYDTSGNVIANTNKGIIKIKYNLLNLPERIYFGNGNVISYTYDADGKKLRVEHGTVKYNMVIPETGIVVKDIQPSDISGYMLTSVKYYDDAYRFTQNTSNGKRLISEINNDGFTIKNVLDKNPIYYFEFTDHLGSVRMVEATNGTSYSYYNFYPYGGNFGTKPQVAGWQKRYCGKEVDLRNGLDMYDWKARWYDPALPRFYTQDRLAENDYAVSPYCYCHDNPVNCQDYDGNSVWSKAAKIGFRVGKSVAKHGWSALTKAATYDEAVSDIREDIGTVFDGNASTWERIGAGASLLSEISPVSWHDVKDGYKTMKKLREKATIGQEAHRQIEKKLKTENPSTQVEVKIELNDNKIVRKDAIKADGTAVIIKPDTHSGHKSAEKRKKLMLDNKYKTEVIFYDPKDSKYLPNSPTYIGPKKK